MKYRIITISREFGSGGRTIAKAVAERLGWKYYDKELVEQVAMETGFDPQFIEETGEHSPDRSGFAYSLAPQGVPGIMRGMSVSDFVWCMQRQVILQLAEKEPCVIVGRCADFILRERDDCFNVFIHAPIPYRADRIVRLYGESEKSPEKRLADKDKKRKVNYRHYTGCEWGMSQNYHLCLDSAEIGEEECVKIITALAGKQENSK